jgi:hypothetical protein
VCAKVEQFKCEGRRYHRNVWRGEIFSSSYPALSSTVMNGVLHFSFYWSTGYYQVPVARVSSRRGASEITHIAYIIIGLRFIFKFTGPLYKVWQVSFPINLAHEAVQNVRVANRIVLMTSPKVHLLVLEASVPQ